MTTKRIAILVATALVAAPAVAQATPLTLTASLTGAAETAGGDADGKGAFTVEVDAETGDFCYSLSASQIDQAMAAHVHSGAAGTDGPPVVSLSMTSDECIAVEPSVLKPIVENPAGYYVNVHTAAYPKGAVRGQLVKK